MRWFTGRFVTARDLTDEQAYFLRRRWLLNRLVHGEGVRCGMRGVGHRREECRPTTVFVEEGVALDCVGRELVLDERLCVTWPPNESAGEEPEEVLLAVRYREKDVAPRYAVRNACATSTVKEPSRVREYVDHRLLTREEAPRCWPAETCGPADDAGSEGCLKPDCRCGGWLPLALLRRCADGPIEIIPIAPGRPTRITWINWTHGGSLSVSEIRERRGRLEIEFERPLLDSDDEAVGINQFTFRVEILGTQRATEVMPFERGPELDHPCRAVFTIDPDLWDPTRAGPRAGYRPSLVGQVVTVTLLCDFVLDHNGNPVDGDHLRGALPTGTGTPGGVFRSWFTVSGGEGAGS
jgi:hypothetical protein